MAAELRQQQRLVRLQLQPPAHAITRLGGCAAKLCKRQADSKQETFANVGGRLSTATLLANGGGRVAYGEGGKTYTWSSSTGQSTLRIDTAPGQLFISGGAMVFTVGPSVYRVGVE